MARSRITTTDLHDALHQLLDENPLRADEGHPEHRLFVYHGKPVELNATLLHHFGASINQLKSLDAAIWSVENDWDKVKHPLRRRYTELAWTCLSRLSGGDTEGAWANSHDYAFGPRDVRLSWIARDYDRTLDGRRRPWLYDAAEFEQPQADRELHPGCSAYSVPPAALRPFAREV
ncbi:MULTISPECIES: hypothetical protein [Streptomyces]|uniref:Uncharacterized protein n=1 Tax=Streptomyces griseiscabiei TaxID=2993540 RepID=A0ABU4LJA4_9ACTN|nr:MULTISPECIES: hypothetical protein [Streptomyces]MBZ3908246.1 hypothetical protein [Streptomyces griseiscabiei]MDX2915658.1 hypothetical protein [Streptomyces griseiscabiei]